ncbi:MAG TPA: hypothetical protein VGQ57_06115 [Polyangiaceae bacterium]|jgi:hypothetical protein|nr:hypothetical protein [Polyangiaceae bacterium]
MADSGSRVLGRRHLWLLLPGLGLLELGAHLWFASRAPGLDAWRALAATAHGMKRPGEPIVVAPEWAEPLARLAFGDAAFPLDELGRQDDRSTPRVLEISELGARAPGSRGWPVVSERQLGPFTLRVLQNPAPLRPRYRFVDHVDPTALRVSLVTPAGERPCTFTEHARVTAGGLHGQVAFPARRFQCPGGDATFVGVTLIDDQNYRPRRCIWAHPPPWGSLRLRFSNVPLGTSLHGYGGLSYFLFRDGVGAPVELSAASGEERFGSTRHHDETGWSSFDFSTAARAGQTVDLDFEVRSGDPNRRDFCFSAEAEE